MPRTVPVLHLLCGKVASGNTVSRARFEELSRYFEPPTPAEGFDVVEHRWR